MRFLTHLSARERLILYVCIIIIVSAIFYSLAIEKIIDIWSDLNLEISKSHKKLIKNFRLIQKEKYISREYEKYIAYMKGDKGGEEKTSSILMEIETLARKNNVATTDITPLGVKAMDFYKKYTFEISAEGNIGSLSRFIYDMQTSSNVLTVEYLSISAKKTRSDILEAEMRLIHASIF